MKTHGGRTVYLGTRRRDGGNTRKDVNQGLVGMYLANKGQTDRPEQWFVAEATRKTEAY